MRPVLTAVLTAISRRLGYVPAALAQADAARQVQLAATRVAANAAAHQRSLLAALTTPDVSSWQVDGTHINVNTLYGLATVRARSRDAAHNNEHARRFLGMVRSNVLGPYGVRYQSRLRTAGGALRTADNDRLESGWQTFAQAGWFDVTGRYTAKEYDRLALRHVAVDGEVFERIHPGRGPHGVQFQLLTSDAVPLTTNMDLPNGNRIRQGIEFDALGAVQAYHARRDDATLDLVGAFGAVPSNNLVRIPAAEMHHYFLPEEAGQLRGIPWMQAALKRMYQASDFASAGLNKARESAKRGGFISPDKDAADPDSTNPQVVAGTDAATGTAYASLQDGTWEKLLPGETATPFESEYPNIEYGQFIKDCTRGIASALDCAYFTLGNDLEAVNFSSGQLGMEGERTMWMALQEWWMDTATRRRHRVWLKYGMLAAPELVGLQYDRLSQYAEAANWLPHRWRPIDQLKTAEAERSMLEIRVTSPQRLIAARGDDPDEIVAEWYEWQEKTKGLGPAVPAGATQPASSTSSTTANDGTPAADGQDGNTTAGRQAAADPRQALRFQLIAAGNNNH